MSSAALSALPANGSNVVDELDTQPGDLRIDKRQWDAFYGRLRTTDQVLAALSS